MLFVWLWRMWRDRMLGATWRYILVVNSYLVSCLPTRGRWRVEVEVEVELGTTYNSCLMVSLAARAKIYALTILANWSVSGAGACCTGDILDAGQLCSEKGFAPCIVG